MTAPEVGTTGMPCRMPLIRSRPWISDSVWCIHESLPAVASIAKMLPLNGLWRFTADGPERLADTRWPDLSAFMVHVCARADDPVERAHLEVVAEKSVSELGTGGAPMSAAELTRSDADENLDACRVRCHVCGARVYVGETAHDVEPGDDGVERFACAEHCEVCR